jgi:dihydrofolate reductase
MSLTNALRWLIVDWSKPHAATTFSLFTVLILTGYFILWFYWKAYEFQVPIFVIGKQVPERKPKENGYITFTFGDTVEAAIEQAKQAAGERDVAVVGGPNVGQQLLKAGLVDELQIGIMPVLLGKGQRLFEYLEGTEIVLQKARLVETGQSTDIWFTNQK